MSPKETKIILEILGLPVTQVAAAINCSKGDLSATINHKRRNRSVQVKFADYISQQVKEKLLSEENAVGLN